MQIQTESIGNILFECSTKISIRHIELKIFDRIYMALLKNQIITFEIPVFECKSPACLKRLTEVQQPRDRNQTGRHLLWN